VRKEGEGYRCADEKESGRYPNICRNETNYTCEYVKHSAHKTDKTDLIAVVVRISVSLAVSYKKAYKIIFFLEANKKAEREKYYSQKNKCDI